MLLLRKPAPELVRRFLDQQSKLEYSYAAVGATAHEPPAGYLVDRTRIELGSGEEVFQAARAALERWEQFRLGWVDVWPTDAAIQSGKVVAVMGRAVGFWWLNACRIVYVVDETEPTRRFGFAYGTLPGHVESGEERFLIDWNQETDVVSFNIFAFSRPNHFLSRLGHALVRRKQLRFGRDSATAMFRAVNGSAPLPRILQ